MLTRETELRTRISSSSDGPTGYTRRRPTGNKQKAIDTGRSGSFFPAFQVVSGAAVSRLFLVQPTPQCNTRNKSFSSPQPLLENRRNLNETMDSGRAIPPLSAGLDNLNIQIGLIETLC